MFKFLRKIVGNNRGISVLISVLIIASIMVVLTFGMGLNSISENQIGLYQSRSSVSFYNVDGCAEEAISRINRDNNYAGETLNLGNVTCVIAISGTGSNRTIGITGTSSEGYVRNIAITVTISPSFNVTSWQENIN
jgi:hypothetical protein